MDETFPRENILVTQEVLDEEWYPRFAEIATITDSQTMVGEKAYRDEQKRQFLAGEAENPTLDYPNLDEAILQGAEGSLLSLKSDVLTNETNPVVKQAYRWRINERIASVRRLEAIRTGDMRRYERYTRFIFGSPSPDVFHYTVDGVRRSASLALVDARPNVREAAQSLLTALPEAQPYSITPLPDEEVFAAAQQHTKEEFGDLLDMPSETGDIGAEETKAAFEKAFDVLSLNGWLAKIDSGSSRKAITIRTASETVLIPAEKERTVDELTKLVIHEIGTHVARKKNGEQTKLKLLGLGLDRYDAGEEGIGIMREQVLDDTIEDFRGLEGYLAIGLAMGIDGQPRTFRQVFEILQKKYELENLLDDKDKETASSEAQDKAWDRTVRTFRGTDCKTPGVCSTRDLYYRDGNIGVWEIIRTNPEAMARFNIGKYDPTNPRHLWILEQLEITDQDLDELEKRT